MLVEAGFKLRVVRATGSKSAKGELGLTSLPLPKSFVIL